MNPEEATAADRLAGSQANKTFTAEQANRALVLVRRVVADIVERYARLLNLRRQRQELSGTVAAQSRIQPLQDDIEATTGELNRLHDELTDIGCVLKDWAVGLVDFPAVCQGRPIWLCWRLGEPAVSHWHELQAGFAGRRPIGPDFT